MSKQSVIDSIREKLAKQSKNSQNSENNKMRWSPKEGEKYTVRIVPYQHGADPFTELHFHYNIGKNIMCPKATFPGDNTKRCAIDEFAQELLAEAKKSKEKNNESWEQFKLLSPRPRPHCPILIRGKESEGVKFWGMPMKTYNTIGKYFLNPQWGDLSDPIDGRDIEVEAIKQNNEKYASPSITPSPNKTKMITTGNVKEDNKKAAEIITSVPEIYSVFEIPSYEDTKAVLEQYLAKGNQEETTPEETLPEETQQPSENENTDVDQNNPEDSDDIEVLLAKMKKNKK